MTDINPFLRHLLRFEAGVADRNLSTDKLFQKAHVKGFANDPDDRGGATMIGVTLAAFTAWRKQHGRPTPTVKELKALPTKSGGTSSRRISGSGAKPTN